MKYERDFLGMLNSKGEGFSIKKVLAFVFSVFSMFLIWRYTNGHNFEMVLAEVLGFILILLGLRAYEKKNTTELVTPKPVNPTDQEINNTI